MPTLDYILDSCSTPLLDCSARRVLKPTVRLWRHLLVDFSTANIWLHSCEKAMLNSPLRVVTEPKKRTCQNAHVKTFVQCNINSRLSMMSIHDLSQRQRLDNHSHNTTLHRQIFRHEVEPGFLHDDLQDLQGVRPAVLRGRLATPGPAPDHPGGPASLARPVFRLAALLVAELEADPQLAQAGVGQHVGGPLDEERRGGLLLVLRPGPWGGGGIGRVLTVRSSRLGRRRNLPAFFWRFSEARPLSVRAQ